MNPDVKQQINDELGEEPRKTEVDSAKHKFWTGPFRVDKKFWKSVIRPKWMQNEIVAAPNRHNTTSEEVLTWDKKRAVILAAVNKIVRDIVKEQSRQQARLANQSAQRLRSAKPWPPKFKGKPPARHQARPQTQMSEQLSKALRPRSV